MQISPRNEIEKKIFDLEENIGDLRKKISKLRDDLPDEELQNYELKDIQGMPVKLSTVFGDKNELLLIHNMGPTCPYCTMMADDLNAMRPYIESRCSIALETDIDPISLKKFAEERKWSLKVLSSAETNLKRDLGFKKENKNLMGVSSLFKKNGNLYRHAVAYFEPGDEHSGIWRFFELLKSGVRDWRPHFEMAGKIAKKASIPELQEEAFH